MSKFFESKTHSGGPETGESITWLGPSLGKSIKARKKPVATAANKVRGICVRWDNDRGFGFLRPLDGGPDIFVHAADLARSNIEGLAYGQCVAFEVIEGKGGKPAAINIEEVK